MATARINLQTACSRPSVSASLPAVPLLVALAQFAEETLKGVPPAGVWTILARRGHLSAIFGVPVRRRGRPPEPYGKEYVKNPSRLLRLLALRCARDVVEEFRAAEHEVGIKSTAGEFWPEVVDCFNRTKVGRENPYRTPAAARSAYDRAEEARRARERQGFDLAAYLRDWRQPPLPPLARAIKAYLLTHPWRNLVPPVPLCFLLLNEGLQDFLDDEERRVLDSPRGAAARHLREAGIRAQHGLPISPTKTERGLREWWTSTHGELEEAKWCPLFKGAAGSVGPGNRKRWPVLLEEQARKMGLPLHRRRQ